MRDRIFIERKRLIHKRHEDEQRFFEGKVVHSRA
jgi:hypothetical protein